MTTPLRTTITRSLALATGVKWSQRGWPADRATYTVEIGPSGIRVRLGRGPWYRTEWADVLAGCAAESGVDVVRRNTIRHTPDKETKEALTQIARNAYEEE